MKKEPLFLGLDVGGTHTDAVLINKKSVVSFYKAVTDHDNLLMSINMALEEVTKDVDKGKIKSINLSTTLSTNAIVENKIEDVGVIVSSGPGIDPENFRIGNYFFIDGSIDHRGRVIKDLDMKKLGQAIDEAKEIGLKTFAAITKFSTRNPDHEDLIGEKISGVSDFTTLGHLLSGQLNFPRRITTAYFNSAVWRIYNQFANAIDKSIHDLGIDAEINILKADGGTMPFGLSRDIPVESILSGPAASIMGIVSLCNISEDSIILDIGGTTTDIAVFASGSPLVERDGISLNSIPTLVRALKTSSIGIGGDSVVKVNGKDITVGPEREGPAMADSGQILTLVDVLNYKGIIEFGQKGRSVKGVGDLSEKSDLSPDSLADGAIECAVNMIKAEVESMLEEIYDRPVYTIHEILEGKRIVPSKLYVMGGPAMAFRDILHGEFGLEVIIPENYAVANAIGAAMAKTTIDVELFADTGKGILLVPNLNVKRDIPPNYTLQEAESDAKRFLIDHLSELGVEVDESDVEVTESSSFNMVQGFSGSGKDIRVKCQIKPEVLR